MRPHPAGRPALLRVLRQGSDLHRSQTILTVGHRHHLCGGSRRRHTQSNHRILRTQLNAGNTAAAAALRAHLRRIEGQQLRILRHQRQGVIVRGARSRSNHRVLRFQLNNVPLRLIQRVLRVHTLNHAVRRRQRQHLIQRHQAHQLLALRQGHHLRDLHPRVQHRCARRLLKHHHIHHRQAHHPPRRGHRANLTARRRRNNRGEHVMLQAFTRVGQCLTHRLTGGAAHHARR